MERVADNQDSSEALPGSSPLARKDHPARRDLARSMETAEAARTGYLAHRLSKDQTEGGEQALDKDYSRNSGPMEAAKHRCRGLCLAGMDRMDLAHKDSHEDLDS